MVEFVVCYSFDGTRIDLGIAIPGLDGSKWPTSSKYRFDLNLEEAEDLMQKLADLLEGARARRVIK